ncbi:hypothetical protein B0J17DRAFT_720271 [Rhizoctonia solani]|nr:hypothetical protein B0J17DRAFT_720271 [Rhizoctonia solani]
MAHVLFDIPEIVRLICKTLDRTSLVRLLAVSRRLFDSVVSLVWENVVDSDAHYMFSCLHPGIIHFFKDGRLKGYKKLELLHEDFRDRWNAYAPLVKRISRNFKDDSFNRMWNVLISNVTSLPCPPNLQVFEFSAPKAGDMTRAEFVSQLDAHLGPSVTKIYYHTSGI